MIEQSLLEIQKCLKTLTSKEFSNLGLCNDKYQEFKSRMKLSQEFYIDITNVLYNMQQDEEEKAQEGAVQKVDDFSEFPDFVNDEEND